jgi:hypothetical protein
VLRVVPYAAVHFASYEWFRRLLYAAAADLRGGGGAAGAAPGPDKPSPALDLLAGAGSGAVAVLATYPLDLLRTQMAYDTGPPPPGGARASAYLARALAAEGPRGLYLGVAPTLLGILPYAGFAGGGGAVWLLRGPRGWGRRAGRKGEPPARAGRSGAAAPPLSRRRRRPSLLPPPGRPPLLPGSNSTFSLC